MKKRIVTIALVVALLATCFAGTYAYLTDTDAAVNTMTLGNVKIEQLEYQRATNEDGSYKTDTIDGRTSYVLEAFEDNKPLFPAVIPNGGTVNGVTWDYDAIPVRMSQVNSHGGASVFNTPNAVDKFVTVANTGDSDAYVRTLIAFEMGTLTVDQFAEAISHEMRADEAGNGKFPWKLGAQVVADIDGHNYYVFELIYCGAQTSTGYKHENGVLPAGATTYPSLCQIYMTAESTNETVNAIDGDGNGKYDILVLSQAVQAAGFENAKLALDTAFGAVTAATAAEWLANIQ